METATVETAPAQPAPVETPAPEMPAASERTRPSFRDFDAAETAKALGKPAPEPTKPKAVEPAKPAASDDDAPALDAKGQPITEGGKPVSRRQHEQNERVRLAAERGIADVRRQYEERIAALEAQIRGDKPPATTEPPPAAKDDGPPKPKLADYEREIGGKYESYADAVEAFQDARDAWRDQVAAQAAEKAKATEAQNTAAQRAHDIIAGHLERERALVATVPDYFEKTGQLRALLDQGLKNGAPLALPLLESPVSDRLLLHFAEHPDEMAQIGDLGKTNLPAALRALGKLEATLESAGAPPAAPTTPPKKTVTSASEPPITLGTRTAEPADVATAAVARGNFRDFDEEMTKRDLARRSRR